MLSNTGHMAGDAFFYHLGDLQQVNVALCTYNPFAKTEMPQRLLPGFIH